MGSHARAMASLIVAAALIMAVVAAVHHAEVVAHRIGEPFGSLVLAIAVTVIEVALVVSLMLSGGASATALARDTVFAAVMIVCTGVVGLCLLVGGLRHHVIAFRVEGTSPALATLAALVTLTLVLPTYTTSKPGPTFSRSQLVFAGAVSLALYGIFVFVQTVRHRDYFLPADVGNEAAHAPPVTTHVALLNTGHMLLCLVAVVGLAKKLAPSIEAGCTRLRLRPAS
jgi:Ca2+:H+ antiporter